MVRQDEPASRRIRRVVQAGHAASGLLRSAGDLDQDSAPRATAVMRY